jgi:hypothetical protein
MIIRSLPLSAEQRLLKAMRGGKPEKRRCRPVRACATRRVMNKQNIQTLYRREKLRKK